MIKRKYAYMRIDDYKIDFEDVENTITYSLSAKNLENNLNKREEELCNKIADLEARLAESEKDKQFYFFENGEKGLKIRELKQQVNDWKQRFESSEERNKQMADNGVKALELKNEKIKELKQQLAEKEEALKYYETLLKRQCNECKDQDKISFAIAELEKVKDYAQHIQGGLINYIDNQINELKELK